MLVLFLGGLGIVGLSTGSAFPGQHVVSIVILATLMILSVVANALLRASLIETVTALKDARDNACKCGGSCSGSCAPPAPPKKIAYRG